MKRILTPIAAIPLALVTLSGCASPVPNCGIISESVYASSEAELTFIAPYGWEYATDYQIAAVKHTYVDNLRSAGIIVSDEMLEKSYIIDMIAADTETGTNVIVFYQNLSLLPGGTNYTEDSFLDANREAENKAGLTVYEFGEYTDVIIGPNTYRMMPFTNMDTGLPQYMCVRRTGGYMLCITITITDGSDIGSIMENFTWVDGQTE